MDGPPQADRDPEDALDIGRDGGSPPSTPRWVLVFGAIAAALVVAFIVLHLMGGGFRGH